MSGKRTGLRPVTCRICDQYLSCVLRPDDLLLFRKCKCVNWRLETDMRWNITLINYTKTSPSLISWIWPEILTQTTWADLWFSHQSLHRYLSVTVDLWATSLSVPLLGWRTAAWIRPRRPLAWPLASLSTWYNLCGGEEPCCCLNGNNHNDLITSPSGQGSEVSLYLHKH